MLLAGGYKAEDARKVASKRLNTVVVYGRYFISTVCSLRTSFGSSLTLLPPPARSRRSHQEQHFSQPLQPRHLLPLWSYALGG